MAEKVLQKLEEQLCCSICLDTYTDPKSLQCFHVYCRKCLVPLVVRDRQRQLGLTCPTCRQFTPVPNRGVAGLQSAFHINRFLEIRQCFEKLDNETATPQVAAPPEDKSLIKNCVLHKGKELELYCETCGELICTRCALRGGKHHDHDYDELTRVFERYQEEITSLLEPMEKQMVATRQELAELDSRCEELTGKRAAIEVSVHATFRQLREVLNFRETDLIGQLDQITQGRLKGLAVQRNRIETTLAQLSSCLYFMRESIRTDNEGDVLKIKTSAVRLAKELTTPHKSCCSEPTANVDMVFSVPVDLTAACRRFGCVGSQSKDTSNHLEAGNVKDRSHAVKKPLMMPQLSISGVIGPWGVAVSKQGEVVVTEWGGHCVSVFSNDGKKHQSFGTRGCGPGQVWYPCGVSIAGDGSLLIADSGNHRIQSCSLDGQFFKAVGTKGSGPLNFSCPSDVAFNTTSKKVYVTDTNNHRIQVLNSDFTYSGSFGTPGNEEGQFHRPLGIAFDSSGEVYVADNRNHRIQVFTADGEFLKMFGRHGHGRGELDGPGGVAIDTSGMVYVSEGGNHRVSVFTSEGQYVTSFGRKGKRSGEFEFPYGLAVCGGGPMFVCDTDNNSVQVFDMI